MDRNWYWRLFLVLGLTSLALYYAVPSAIYFFAPPEVRRSKTELAARIPDFFPKRRITLGIDLQGGLHLVMGVDTDKAAQDRADRISDELVSEMEEKGAPLKSAKRPGDDPIVEIELGNSSDWDKLTPMLDERKDTWTLDSHSGTFVRIRMKPEFEHTMKEDAVQQAQKTLRNRIDTYGVTEPEVRKRGANSVLIQIAGLTADQERSVKEEIIGKTAQLEFKMVDDASPYFGEIGAASDKPEGIELVQDSFAGKDDSVVRTAYLTAKTKQELQDFITKHPQPTDRVVRFQEIKNRDGSNPRWRTWLLDRKTPLTGDSLTNAFVAFDNDKNNYYVAMKFDKKGGVMFEKLTRENVKRRMAIVLDDVVDSAPVIEGPIPNGNASITLGGFKSQQEILEDAKSLSIVLKAGALPAPVYPQEQRTVGATLGDDAIAKGKLALILTMAFVSLTMLIYYRLSGVIAVIAMSFHMLLLFAGLAALNATLTLPGIAGLALTLGMSVDANVIQFERIREELALGKTVRAAVDTGIHKAFSAIFDSNVTTMLAAIVLYQYGSGPVRGFATTLALGVFVNGSTAVIIPRLILEYLTRGRKIQELSI